jgi:uncharacterized protein (UPF0332 family)
MTSLHFVRTEKLPSNLAHVLSQVARTREDADYDAAMTFSDQDAARALELARQFVAAARDLLEQDGWLGE